MTMKRQSLVFVVAAALAAPGCATIHWRGGAAPKAGTHTYRDKAHNAYQDAMNAMDAHDWKVALTRLRNVKDHFPYSKYAALAEVRIADALYGQDKFLEAADAYARFAKVRPGNPDAPYAAYRTGVAYMRQAPSTFFLFPPAYEKDLSDVRKAIAALQDFLDSYPGSKYRPKAKALLKTAQDRLIDHEMYVAHFYRRHRKWRGMAWRLEGVLKKYPGQGYDARAKVGLAEAYLHYDKPRVADARKLLGEVLEDHPSPSVEARAKALEKDLPAVKTAAATPAAKADAKAPATKAPAAQQAGTKAAAAKQAATKAAPKADGDADAKGADKAPSAPTAAAGAGGS